MTSFSSIKRPVLVQVFVAIAVRVGRAGILRLVLILAALSKRPTNVVQIGQVVA